MNECRRQAINRFKERGVKPVYITVSGSHLYGFPSKDSDIDIRCCHIEDTKSFFHLSAPSDIIQWKSEIKGVEIEFESMEILKTIGLAMGNNSNILEHIFSKNLLTTEPREFLSLKKLAKESISKVVYNPYNGMAEFNYRKFIESMNPTYDDKLVKKYLYVMRAYLVGTHALLTGEIEPNIRFHLKKEWGYDSAEDKKLVRELIDKKEDAEYQVAALDHKQCREAIARMKASMMIAKMESKLPEKPANREAWDDFLLNVRLRNL
jgi:predicted nucleotidyltransferase